MKTITSQSFESEVLASKRPYLLEFGAVWCGPCKRMEPEMDKLNDIWSDKVKIGRIDVDEAADIAINFQIMSVPTVLLFVNGEAVERMSGYQPIEKIISKFESHI
ncbi:MAG TPA: thioredoxin domain-containing protein [Bellilinea sp.]|nr:thioredoxin domain-containing protein [Bellilinea sp.]